MTATQFVQTHGNKAVSGALIVALYVTVIAAGWFLAYRPAQAAALSSISDTLSVSVPSSASNHTILFTVTTTIAAGGSFSIDFQGSSVVFGTGSVAFGDVDVASGGGTNDYTLAATAAGQTLGVTISGSALHVQLGASNTIEAGEVLQVQIGTNAAGGVNRLTNPTSTTGTAITISTFTPADVALDSGGTFVAIQPQVTLQATVNNTFVFVVDGMTAAVDSIDSYPVDNTSTPTLADFGTVVAGTPETMGSSLSVTSNALNGFVVTVEQNHNMLSSAGADIDSFANGTPTTGAAWSSPTAINGSENTYGHLGLTTEDGIGTDFVAGASVSTATNGNWFGFTGTTLFEIWDNDSTGDGNSQDTGHIDVGYRIQISGLQEAGTYTNQLMYIATPTF